MYKKILLLLTVCNLAYAEPQAIVFDFGGVMTGKPNKDVVVHFLRETFHFTPLEFEKVNREKHKAIEEGKTDLQFWLEYADRKHIQLPSSWANSFYDVMRAAIGANPQMFQLVNELKQRGYQIVLLSNIDRRLGNLIKELGYYDCFDQCLLSYEIGYEKPDTRIYLYLLNKLVLEPADIVFIDDRKDNVDSANSVGIDAIHFTSCDQLKDEFEKRAI